MHKLQFFVRYALHGLVRGGQRTFIAILSVAFGVMALTAMSLMSFSIVSTFDIDRHSILGGDLSVWSGSPFGLDEVETFEALQQEGLLTAYSPQAVVEYQMLMKNVVSGRADTVNQGMGIDPSVYPLKGELTITTPKDATLADLLHDRDSVVITRDIAASQDLSIGDVIRVTYLNGSAVSIPLHVTGIADDNPTHSGGTLYYSLETAAQFYSTPQFITNVKLNTTQSEQVQQRLASEGWDIYTSDEVITDSATADFFETMLKGAGILGLLVGGIGIANTMQVLLSQRVREVAVLKTLGYSQRDMMFIFTLEAAWMGVTGSLIGMVIGVFISKILVQLFANVGTTLLMWQMNLPVLVIAVLSGVMSTILFAMYAIVRTSGVSPAEIFRQQTIESNTRQWAKALLFYAVLSIPFAMITTLILGSVVEGIGVLIFALVGLIVLGLVLGVSMWLVLRFLPTFRFHLLYMARNHMRKRGFSLLFAMIALFVGIYTLGFATTIIQISVDQADMRADPTREYNLSAYVQPADAASVRDLLQTSGAAEIQSRSIYNVQRISLVTDGIEQSLDVSQVSARETLWDVQIQGGADYQSAENAIYLPFYMEAPVGAEIRIQTYDGRTITGLVAGIMETVPLASTLTYQRANGLLVSEDLMNQIAGDNALIAYFATLSDGILNETASIIGEQIPSSSVMTSVDFAQTLNNAFNNLFVLAVAMAGLALLAGMMLVANVVSLAMMRRRYEIGVMKAVGYTRRHILTTLAMEYGLISFIASAVGLLAVQITLFLLIWTQSPSIGSALLTKPTTALLIMVVGMGLTIFTAMVAAWHPTQVQPVAILNEN